jgi:ankyrin repeat protein
MFLESGANVRKANTDGTTPLQAAIDLDHVAVVNLLNEYRDHYYQRTREWIRSTLDQEGKEKDLPVRRHWLVKMLMYHTEELLTYNDEYPDMHLLSDAVIKFSELRSGSRT